MPADHGTMDISLAFYASQVGFGFTGYVPGTFSMVCHGNIVHGDIGFIILKTAP